MLPVATSLTTELLKPAINLLEQLYQFGTLYEKAGVIFEKLVPDTLIQANFFTASTKREQRSLMSKVDNINFSMRNEIVKFASSGIIRPWKMKQELLSPKYTTRWSELKTVS